MNIKLHLSYFLFISLFLSSFSSAECPVGYADEVVANYHEIIYSDVTLTYLLIDDDPCEANMSFSNIDNSDCFIIDIVTTGNIADVLPVDPVVIDCSCYSGYTFDNGSAIDDPSCVLDTLIDDDLLDGESDTYIIDENVDLGLYQDAVFYIRSCKYYEPIEPDDMPFYVSNRIESDILYNFEYEVIDTIFGSRNSSSSLDCFFDPNKLYSVSELVAVAETYNIKDFQPHFTFNNSSSQFYIGVDIAGHKYSFDSNTPVAGDNTDNLVFSSVYDFRFYSDTAGYSGTYPSGYYGYYYTDTSGYSTSSAYHEYWGLVMQVEGAGFGDSEDSQDSGSSDVDLTPVLDLINEVAIDVSQLNNSIDSVFSNVSLSNDLLSDSLQSLNDVENSMTEVQNSVDGVNSSMNDVLAAVNGLDGSGFDDSGIIDSVVGLGSTFTDLIDAYFGGVDDLMLSDTEEMFNESDDLIDAYFIEQDGLISSTITDHGDFDGGMSDSLYDRILALIPDSGECVSLTLNFSAVGFDVPITCERTQNMRDVLGFFMYLSTTFYLIGVLFSTRSAN